MTLAMQVRSTAPCARQPTTRVRCHRSGHDVTRYDVRCRSGGSGHLLDEIGLLPLRNARIHYLSKERDSRSDSRKCEKERLDWIHSNPFSHTHLDTTPALFNVVVVVVGFAAFFVEAA